MSNHIVNTVNFVQLICETTEKILQDQQSPAGLQIPTLVALVGTTLKRVASSDIKIIDAVIRYYINNEHPVYYISRGTKGGIALRAEKQKKLDAQEAKQKAKEELKKELEEKLLLKS